MTADPPYAHILRRTPSQDRSVQRVEAILDAAADLLHNRDPEQITVRELAHAAGVPTGTVYQFFADKDAVLQALAVRFVAGFPAVLDEATAMPGGTWNDTIERVVLAYAAAVRAHPAIRRLWLSGTLDAATRQIERETDATIAAALGAALQRQAASLRGTAAQWEVLVALINGLLVHAFTADPDGDEDILREAVRAADAYAGAILTG